MDSVISKSRHEYCGNYAVFLPTTEIEMMRRNWFVMFALVLLLGIFAGAMITQANQASVKIDTGWRYHDGYWNYWDPDDRSWYYTDGRNWYTYGDDAWKVYSFDKGFGKKSFYREGYVLPKAGAEIVLPRHKVYVPR
jgi:hypothetical protein